MQIQNDILIALESLAAFFPWEQCGIDIRRKPEGEIHYNAVIYGNTDLGLGIAMGYGQTPEEAVEELKSRFPNGERDPEKIRDKTLAALQEKIDKLRKQDFGLPPYVLNRELLANNPTVISV